jgi:hypothetical protein
MKDYSLLFLGYTFAATCVVWGVWVVCKVVDAWRKQ